MIEDAIYSIGTAHAGLSAIIGTSLYPVGRQKSLPVPSVVFGKGDRNPVAAIYGNTGWAHTTFEFTCHAATAREASLLAAQVRAAYERYWGTAGGVSIDNSLGFVDAPGNDTAYYDDELGCYAEELELTFFHTE